MTDGHSKQFIQLGMSRSALGKHSQSATKKSSNQNVGQPRGRADDDDLTRMKVMQNNFTTFNGKNDGDARNDDLNLRSHNLSAAASEIHRIEKGHEGLL